MEEYQKRMLNEYKELNDRCIKLEKFIMTDKFDELCEEEQFDMHQQLNYMKQYRRILKSRCERQNIDVE